jgi:hypothetical protein
LHFYCKGVVAGGSDHTITDRNGGTHVFLDIATTLKNDLGAIWGTTPGWGPCVLEQKSGTQWLPVRAWTVAAPGGIGTPKLGSQVTLTLRDLTFRPVKVVVLDTNQTPPYHYIGMTDGDANLDSFVGNFADRGAGYETDPFYWMVGRNNQYLSLSPFVSVSADINRKTKKAHGL